MRARATVTLYLLAIALLIVGLVLYHLSADAEAARAASQVLSSGGDTASRQRVGAYIALGVAGLSLVGAWIVWPRPSSGDRGGDDG